MTRSRRLVLLAATSFMIVAPAVSAEDSLSGAAMGESSAPDEHHAESEDIDSLEGQSEDIHRHEGHAGTIDSRHAEAEDIHDHEGRFEEISDHEASSTALQNLPDADEQAAEAQLEALHELREEHGKNLQAHEASESAPTPTGNRMKDQIAAVHHAKQRLQDAKQAAHAADSTYAKMLENDYPRGEARLKIVEERKLAHQELNSAEQQYDAAINGGGGPASN